MLLRKTDPKHRLHSERTLSMITPELEKLMPSHNAMITLCAHALRLIPVLVAFFQPLTCAAGDAVPSGYATLVRQVAPSVVTVIVEERSVGAGERAAARATADAGYDAVGAIIRRLLAGANGSPGTDD